MTDRTVVDGVGIAYDVTGPPDAPAMALVHSLGQDRSMWAPQVRSWRRSIRLLTVDLRGHGRSGAPAGPYTVSLLATDVRAAATAVGIDRFHLCGISIGGLVAQRIAIDAPDRVLSLVAANTAARIGSEESWRARIDLIRDVGMHTAADTLVPAWFAPGFPAASPEEYANAVAVFRRTSAEGYIGCCSALAAADLRDEVGSIAAPTLVIGGELDRSTPPDDVRRLHDSIPGSELEIISGAAHLSNLDAAAAFTERVARFVGAIAS